MQYVRSISGSVSKTWNSINPATLSGAIDVIVVEHPDGTLACSPFHVRFGKFSLLRPYEKKVEFRVNDVRQDYAMKLGEGGEAFFVFETSAQVPEGLQTSPLVSPVTSPETRPQSAAGMTPTADLEPLDLNVDGRKTLGARRTSGPSAVPMLNSDRRTHSDFANAPLLADPHLLSQSYPGEGAASPLSQPWTNKGDNSTRASEPPPEHASTISQTPSPTPGSPSQAAIKSNSPPLLPRHEALTRALTLSKKLQSSNIPSKVNDEGDLMLDMTGYKSSEEDSLRAEVLARQILSEELEGNYDIGSLIGADEKGNLWIYSSEEAKEAAARKALFGGMHHAASISTDAVSDPGYHSDDMQSQSSLDLAKAARLRRESDSAVGTSPPESPGADPSPESARNYAKTLRLTSDQLKSLNLKPGPNPISFSVNRATCQAYMYLWKSDVPIVVSDVDGTITKSDALGHVLNMIGRDWTHLGVAKLYSDIVANGYCILYLTSRSVGQADTTRTYINNINQEGYKLPKGPVIMSPDRTIAALRREIYLRKPEVFKMACLRDIMSLFNNRKSPFYAGFGNRLTDALSYRSVNIPSTRIFTINSNAEVSLDLLSLNTYKTGYVSMRETVDHFFPPTGQLVQEGGEEFTDFNYWRSAPLEMDEFSLSESDDDDDYAQRRDSIRSEDEGSDEETFSDELGESYLSRESIDDAISTSEVRPSIESDGPRRLVRIQSGDLSIDDAANVLSDDLDALDLISQAARSHDGGTVKSRARSQTTK